MNFGSLLWNISRNSPEHVAAVVNTGEKTALLCTIFFIFPKGQKFVFSKAPYHRVLQSLFPHWLGDLKTICVCLCISVFASLVCVDD